MAKISLMTDLAVLGGLTAVVLVGRFLPRLSAYVLGPGVLIGGCWFLGQAFKASYRTDGSAGGLVLIFFVALVFIAACIAGFLLIAGGLKQINREAQGKPEIPQHLREDSAQEKQFLEAQRRAAAGLIRLQADREKQKDRDATYENR